MQDVFRRVCAFIIASVVCTLFCALAFTLPRLRAHADAQELTEEFIAQYIGIRTTQIAGAFLAEDLIQSVPATILGIEAAYAAMYIVSDDPTVSVTSGNTKYFGGFTYYNGDPSQGVYFGSGYINNDARISRVDVTTSDVEFPNVPVSIELICKAYDSNTTPFGVYNGANRGWSGTYYIAENYWGSQGGLMYVDTTVNGDYVRNNGESLPLFIGSVSSPSSSRLSVSACGATFYSGGIDTNNYLHSLPLTGNMQTDLQIIHDDLEDDFPDDLPLYWVDPYAELEDPTEETTEETTEDLTEETTESNTDVVQPFTLPPEWLETYPIETETFAMPIPPEATMPPVEIDESTGEGLLFWKEYWESFMDDANNEGLLVYVYIIIALSVAEFVIWHIGSKLH